MSMKRKMGRLLYFTSIDIHGKWLHLVDLMAKEITVSLGQKQPQNLLSNFGEFFKRKSMSILIRKIEIKPSSFN